MTAGSSPEHLNGKCLTVNEDLFYFCKITGTDSMKRDVRITILKSEMDQKLAEEYAVSGFEACPFHKAGQFLSVTVGINRKDCASMHGNQ